MCFVSHTFIDCRQASETVSARLVSKQNSLTVSINSKYPILQKEENKLYIQLASLKSS